jgi:hypothetical protein
MGVVSKFKHRFLNAFRELFIYHHTSLEFRASVFAIVIAANDKAEACEFDLIEKAGMEIYGDRDRCDSLIILTREYVQKVWDDNGLDIDKLATKILTDLKAVPRYCEKINIDHLQPILECNTNEDTRLYQERILEFLQNSKTEFQEKMLR